jgi:hypothetical protein
MSMPEIAYLDESAAIERNDRKFRTLWARAHGHFGIARFASNVITSPQSVRTDWNFHKIEPIRDRMGSVRCKNPDEYSALRLP